MSYQCCDKISKEDTYPFGTATENPQRAQCQDWMFVDKEGVIIRVASMRLEKERTPDPGALKNE